MQYVVNTSDKPFVFTADGKSWVIPPKQPAKGAVYYYLATEKGLTPDMMLVGRNLVPVLHPHSKEPILRTHYKTVVKTSPRQRKGALNVNRILVNETVVRELKRGTGPDAMIRCGIKSHEIIFGTQFASNLDREIEEKQAELARLDRELDARRAASLATLEQERAALLSEVAEAEEAAQEAVADVALSKEG